MAQPTSVLAEPDPNAHLARRADSRELLNVVGTIQILVVLLVGALLYFGMKAPSVTVSPEAVAVRGGWLVETVLKSNVTEVALVDALPRVTGKRGGFAAGGKLRGIFDVEGMGQADLFITRGRAPYVIFKTLTRPIVLNFGDPTRTRQFYADVRREWRLPE